MKLMIASDLHGSAYYCRKLIDAYKESGAERLLLLGDILYHGPRNDLPKDYNPKEVVAMLNPLKNSILCIRGNCDSEVDQMVLDFPLAEDSFIVIDKLRIFATHGHHFNPQNLPPLSPGDILLNGHTHVPAIEPCGKNGEFTYVNPGSTSLPKEGSGHQCLLLEKGNWKVIYLQED